MYKWQFDENGKPVSGVSFSISFGPSIYDRYSKEYQLSKEVARIVSKELGVRMPEICLYEIESNTLGQYDNGRIFVAVGKGVSSEMIIETVAHEIRHHWQDINQWEFDFSVPYHERPHEIDAYKYGKDFVRQWTLKDPSL